MNNAYSSEVAEQILAKFNEKGWNLYKTNNNPESDYAIKNNLATSLELNGKYVILPVANNPNDPAQVFDALEVLAQKLNREMPTININNEKHELSGFTLEPSYVKVHTPEGTRAAYQTFLNALESLIKTN